MEQEEKYSCQNPGCGTTGSADQMWTLDLRATGGKKGVVWRVCCVDFGFFFAFTVGL